MIFNLINIPHHANDQQAEFFRRDQQFGSLLSRFQLEGVTKLNLHSQHHHQLEELRRLSSLPVTGNTFAEWAHSQAILPPSHIYPDESHWNDLAPGQIEPLKSLPMTDLIKSLNSDLATLKQQLRRWLSAEQIVQYQSEIYTLHKLWQKYSQDNPPVEGAHNVRRWCRRLPWPQSKER